MDAHFFSQPRCLYRTLSRTLVSLGIITVLVACQPPLTEHKETILAFGTLVDITLWGVSDAQATMAIEQIRKDLDTLHRLFHPWQSGPMGRTNILLETTGTFSANPSVLPLIVEAKTLSSKSGGLFNPAVGRLIKLWGFQGDDLPTGPPPTQAKIDTLLAQKPRMEDLAIQGIRLENHNPAVQLDMGGIAKGYALDRIMEHLHSLGIHNAIINAGGDLKASGKHGERPWHIGIRHPRREGVLASLDVQDGECVFTSGDYERGYDYKGQRYHHIIDPRTGRPVRGTRSVTVLHHNATTADAAATALFVAGPNAWPSVAKAMGIKHVMLVDDKGHIQMTPAMAKRVELTDKTLAVTLFDI